VNGWSGLDLHNIHLLSLIVFLPAVGAAVLLLFDGSRVKLIRWWAFAVSLAEFALSLPLFFGFDLGTHLPQFVERKSWIESWGAYYYLGVDGISLLLVLLTTFLTAVSVLASFKSITEKVKGFMVSMLFLETGMLGVFLSLDFLLFYVFWEAMLIPMYFLIGIWGGPRRVYAAVKFFLYTMFGSVLMLVGILALYFVHRGASGEATFNILTLSETVLSSGQQLWIFLAFFIGFAIKVPLFPFHTWLPDAHVEAPTAGSVLLAGVLLKMGTYGFIRFCLPILPSMSVQLGPFILVLAVIGIIYGAAVAMVQPDLKKLVAYSSVSHLGFVVLGIFAMNIHALEGSILQMVNHGLSTGALFLVVGMIYERRHTRMIAEFGGVAKTMPVFAAMFGIVMLSSIGLPGLNGFVGEFLILLGTFKTHLTFAVIAASGIVLAAIYMLWMFQRVMFGKIEKEENARLKDVSVREGWVLAPVIALIILIGVCPRPFLARTEPTVRAVLKRVEERSLLSRTPGSLPSVVESGRGAPADLEPGDSFDQEIEEDSAVLPLETAEEES